MTRPAPILPSDWRLPGQPSFDPEKAVTFLWQYEFALAHAPLCEPAPTDAT
jgi:hypothetical protein